MRTPRNADHSLRTVTLLAAVAALALGASALCGCNKRSVNNNTTTTKASNPGTPTAAKSSAPAPGTVQPAGAEDQDGPSPAAPVPDASMLPVVPEPSQFNLGHMTGGERKQVSVNLRNKSDQPVTIAKVQSSCRCTTVGNYAGTVIPPGGAIPIIAQYESPRETGPYHQRVWVYVEGFNDTYLTIPLEAEVVLAVRAVPGFLSSRETDAGYGPIKVEAVDGQAFHVLAVDGKEPVYLDDYKPGGAPRTSYLLQWDLRPYANPCNNMPWWLIIETDHPRTPLLDVRVRHKCATVSDFEVNGRRIWILRDQTWRLSEMRTLAGVHKPGETFRMTIPTKDMSEKQDIVSAVPLMSSIRDVKIIGDKWNENHREYTIEVTPAPDVRGLFKCVVDFTANDHTHCPIWFYGVIRE